MYKNVDLSYILDNFNVKNFNIQKIKEKTSKKTRIVYKIKSYDNFFCLKQTYFKIKDLLFIYSYLEWLNLYKFDVPYLIKSKQNKPFVKYDNKIYILTNWINGKKLNYDNLNECIQSIIFLSNIHKFSNKILLIDGAQSKNNFIDLNQKYTKHINELHKMHTIAKLYKDTFSQIFILNFNDFLYLSNIAKQFSHIINFKNLNISACHGDYVNKNILISNKKIIPIDFDRSCINFSVFDLAYFLRRYLRRTNTNWNFESAITLINNYDKNNPLFLDEYLYLIAYLSFPQKFWKISKFYFSNIKKLSSYEKSIQENLLLKTCASINKHMEFSYLFEKYINFNFNFFKK